MSSSALKCLNHLGPGRALLPGLRLTRPVAAPASVNSFRQRLIFFLSRVRRPSRSSAPRPSMSVSACAAPRASSAAMASSCSRFAAIISAVRPFRLLTFASAPTSSSSVQASAWPWLAACISGVQSSKAFWSGRTPAASSARTTSWWRGPCAQRWMAKTSGVRPNESKPPGDAPPASRACVRAASPASMAANKPGCGLRGGSARLGSGPSSLITLARSAPPWLAPTITSETRSR